MQACSAHVLVATVSIYAYVVFENRFPCGAERFDGEDVAFLHALGSFRLDKGHLFVAMDLVAEDIVAGDVADCFDGYSFVVECYFVRLHYFLDGGADVVDAGVDAGFLGDVSVLR